MTVMISQQQQQHCPLAFACAAVGLPYLALLIFSKNRGF